MKASTLFALTVAVLLGLGVAVAAKTFGLFSLPHSRPSDPVAAKRLKSMCWPPPTICSRATCWTPPRRSGSWPLRADELVHYNANKADYLLPNPQMVYLRVANTNIETDQPLLRSHLQEMAKPDLLRSRLVKNMRAINLSLPRERSAGGMINVGEWVDVFVTSTIESASGGTTTRTACVAPQVRVVAKRNTLWPVFAPLPEGKPVHFTLEVNPYRAALIDYVGTHGTMMITPLSACDQKELEEKRQQIVLLENDNLPVGLLYGAPEDNETEAAKIAAVAKGELAVGAPDMVRLFGLTTGAPPTANIAIERFTGIRILETAQFSANGSRTTPPAGAAGAHHKGASAFELDYRFSAPGECATCDAAKKGKN